MTASSPNASPQKFVRCPGCGERLGVRAEHVGRKARCTKCGRVFQIGQSAPAAADPGPAEAPADASTATSIFDEAELPARVSFECSLCQTRMTASSRDAGRQVKCPDCGRQNVIPKPTRAEPKKPPAAFEGEQIGLWDVEARTWDPDFAGDEPLHAVECRLCQTLMYATEAQLGRELKCPDCGALTVAERAAPTQRSARLEVEDGYDLDPSSAPTPRPVPVPIALRDAEQHEHARATTVGPDGRLVVKKEARIERAVRPAMPLVQGVWSMLLTSNVIAVWILASLLFGGAAWLIAGALLSPFAGYGSIMRGFMRVRGAALGLVGLMFSAPLCLAIVTESAEGHARMYDPPELSPLDWMGEAMYLINSLAVAAAAPAALAWAVGGKSSPEAMAAVAGVAVVGAFPLAYLGALLNNSPFAVFSPKLLSTLMRRPGPWLLFYIEAALLTAATGGACYFLLKKAPAGILVAPSLVLGALLLEMRLMGRLAWWLADVMPAPNDDGDADVDDAAAAHPHLAADRAAKRAEAKSDAARQSK
jgi:DNA-directed RNA polymerase subunit M/transcription elongation factor TFIIS